MQHLATVSARGELSALHRVGAASAKPPLIILHANGFGSALYVPMVNAGLSAHFTVYALDAPGQAASPRRAAPGTPGALAAYPHLALAAVDWLKERGLVKDALYAFGHSGGGLAVVLAATYRPNVFTSIYLYEPVVLPRPFLASTPLLVASARRRRATFVSRKAAASSLASKPPMSLFDGAVLNAYIAACLVDRDDGAVALAADPADEAAVYEEAADLGAGAWSGLASLATTPTTVAGSGDGGPLAQVAPEIATAAGALLDTFATLTHLGPFEKPGDVAARVVGGLLSGRARL